MASEHNKNGERLRAIRTKLKLSTQEMALALGYQGSNRSLDMHIRRFELGHRPIPIRTLRLALMFDAYGVPPKWRVRR